jgi:cytochrome c oxidase subunit 2
MRFTVIAQPPEEFAAWEAAQALPAPAPTTAATARGRDIFVRATCVNCHPTQGLSARANAGPDLTHVAGRQLLGAGALTNTPAGLAHWLENPRAIKPSCRMPDFKLDPAQIEDLVAYLQTLK